jgi:hypothetical protein
MMGPTMKPKIQAAINTEIFLTRLSIDELIDIRTSQEGQNRA